jgi:S-formylglutathione hydrolase FrmB
MALIQCDFFSEVLGLSTSMNVILPQAARGQIGVAAAARSGPHPVLYLLHGLSDDHTIWCRRTSIERYVAPLGLAVVMPAVGRSFYTDQVHGLRYWTFVSEELPETVASLFPVSTERDETFVAGLSMGGYGAFKLALRQPERFAAAASLSGALDLSPRFQEERDEARLGEWADTFGDLEAVAGSDEDLTALAEKLAAAHGPRPALYQWCGTEDFLHEDNVRFRDHARRLGLDLVYEEGPGGHEWACWDRQIRRVLEWLPIEPAEDATFRQ